MDGIDRVADWLSSVSYSHSQSKATEVQYKRVWARFCSYLGKSADEIVCDYETLDDRAASKKYALYVRSWISELSNPKTDREPITNHSIKVYIGAVKSFFKYNDLPLGHVPQAMNGTLFHNRDITKDEIVAIMAVCKVREKAFFGIMAQSGLRPHTIVQLKLKHIESLDKVPCKIEVPREIAKGKFGSYVTFIAPDAIKYLQQYLATRTNLTPNSLLFCAHDNPNKPADVKAMSRAFRLAARKLEESGALKYEIRLSKPSELRLYNLRKFFRKYAHQMSFENVNYLMGHIVRGSDANYKPQDPEFYRDLYAEKAMPFLRLEAATPTETTEIIETLKKQHQAEIEAIKAQYEDRLAKIENALFPKVTQVEDAFVKAKTIEESAKNNPEEAKREKTAYYYQDKEIEELKRLIIKNPENVANYLQEILSQIDLIKDEAKKGQKK